MMNGSNVANTTTSSTKSKEDQVVNGHEEKENNPFAEYMWMENEEDFNRQVRQGGSAFGSKDTSGPCLALSGCCVSRHVLLR